MEFANYQNGTALKLVFSGRLATATATMLEAEVKLEYISSAGLRVFLSAQKTMNKWGV